MMIPTFTHWNLAHQRVFLRADLNVPTESGKIENDFRLIKIQPTLDFLIKHHAQVILATHIGKPKNKEPELSTRILIPWFEQHGYTIRFVEEIDAIARMPIIAREIILLENLRFFAGEKKADPLFAKQLAHTAHYYIDDAFGTIHEHDCSVALLPYEFPEDKRSIGFLIEQELCALNELKNNPPRPFVALVGGKKIEDKIPLIAHLLDKLDTLIICPALCFTFLKALHQPIGKSLFAPDMIETCKKMMLTAENMNVDYIFPRDYQVAYDSIDGPLATVDAHHIPDNAIGISVGPQSVQQFQQIITHAQTIFFNCAMGFAERPETRESTKQIIQAMAQSSARTFIAGGDSVATALSTQDYDKIGFLSSGGGAALAYLSGELLPGLVPFEEE
jgi:phosphoglycerate kinase